MTSATSRLSKTPRLMGKGATEYLLDLMSTSSYLNQSIVCLGTSFFLTVHKLIVVCRNQVCELMKLIINCIRVHAPNQEARNAKADQVSHTCKGVARAMGKGGIAHSRC